MDRRVVVTGLGVLSCIGNDVKTFWDNLVNGVCGIDYITEFPTDGLAVKIGGMVRGFNPEDYGMDKPFIRKQDPFTIFAMASAFQAMQDSGLVSGENIDPSRLGTYVGSGIGGFTTIQRELEKFFEDQSGQWVSPNFVPTMISDMAGGQIAIKFGAQGSSGCGRNPRASSRMETSMSGNFLSCSKCVRDLLEVPEVRCD